MVSSEHEPAPQADELFFISSEADIWMLAYSMVKNLKWLAGAARTMCYCNDDVQDILSDITIKLVRALAKQFEADPTQPFQRKSVMGLISTIWKRHRTSYYRDKGRRPNSPPLSLDSPNSDDTSESIGSTIDSHAISPADKVASNEAIRCIKAELTPNELRAVEMSEQGFKSNEIAAKLGIKLESVSRIKARVRAKIEALLRELDQVVARPNDILPLPRRKRGRPRKRPTLQHSRANAGNPICAAHPR